MTEDISFETLDLLTTLGNGRKNAKPLALIARQMDIPKRRVLKLIDRARTELENTNLLVMNNGHGGFYLMEAINGTENQELLELFR